MKKTICLTMIVKNEEKCIARCLNYMKDYIDYWVICDTGSTDNTVKIIKETMEGIPGEVLHHDWKDFATNRNLGINAAKDKADYILIMDADDSLIVQDKDLFLKLEADAYRLKIFHGGIEYYRPQLVRSSVDFKYVGVLHEYIDLQKGITYEALDGCYIQTSFDGNRSKNPNKYLDDCKVLEKGIADEPDNDRYYFYLAQSYRDAGLDLKAIEIYEKRVKMGRWIEEVFISLFEIAKAKERLGFDLFDVETAYLKAAYSNTNRAGEALNALSKYFRLKNNFNKGYCYAKEALKYPRPNEGLFIDYGVYKYRILDEISVSGYYLGHYKEGYEICKKLLDDNLIPQHERPRIEMNLKFHKEGLEKSGQ